MCRRIAANKSGDEIPLVSYGRLMKTPIAGCSQRVRGETRLASALSRDDPAQGKISVFFSGLLGSRFFIGTFALVLFQFRPRIELRAADQTLV
jgi:hypothetical protein